MARFTITVVILFHHMCCVLSWKPNDVAITMHFLHAMFSKFIGDLKIFDKILDLQSPIISNASAESFLGVHKNTTLAN